jgi:hypothetical protein
VSECRQIGRWILFVALCSGAAGCGRKGDPIAPLSAAAENVRDLHARVRCQGVELSFTVPQVRTDGTELEPPLRFEVYRRRYRAEPSPTPAPVQTPQPDAAAGTPQPDAAAAQPTPGAGEDARLAPGQQSPVPPTGAEAAPTPQETPPAGPPARQVVPAGKFDKIGEVTYTAQEAAALAARRTPTPRAVPTAGATTTPVAVPTPQRVRLSFLDTGATEALEVGYTYLYQLVVLDEDGEMSAPSNTVQADYAVLPAAPEALAAEASRAGVQLRWRPPRGDCSGAELPPLEGYAIYRRGDAPEFPVVPLHSVPVAETAYLDATVEFDRIYTYAVRAVAALPKRESESSREVAVEVYDLYPPEPPSGLVATRSTEGVNLLWNPSPSKDVGGYHIHREARGAGWQRLTSEPVHRTSYLDTNAPPRQRLRYRITTVDRSIRKNESVPSEAVPVDEP